MVWGPLDRRIGISVRRQALDRHLESVRGRMRGRVLEIGCGSTGRRGAFRPPALLAHRWVYLDLERSKQPNVQADAERLPFAAASFDTIVCLEVLEYVSRPDDALREMRRVLGPEGALILSTPFLHRADHPRDLWRFTEHGLRTLLRRAGFDVIDLTAQGHALATAANILRAAIYAEPQGWRRRALGLVAWPLLALLRRLDRASARRRPELATFSTGYLVIAEPITGGPQAVDEQDAAEFSHA